MSDSILNNKQALPNKLLQADGTITDIAGNAVVDPVDSYKAKPAIPNKFLNSDGTYSTLADILSGMIDTDLFIVVEELPASGNVNKIYLLVDGDDLKEYHWTGTKWDPIGTLDIDISQYSTTEEMNAAILVALNTAKDYADSLFRNVKPQVLYFNPGQTTAKLIEFWEKVRQIQLTMDVIVCQDYGMVTIKTNSMVNGANYYTFVTTPSKNISSRSIHLTLYSSNS